MIGKFTKLKNGLECIIDKISGVNVISIYLVIKTGSKNDPNAKEGISHFLEHMIFKGNNENSGAEIIDTIERLGGTINAYTSLDETAFYINILKENWIQGLNILKSMVFNADFNLEEFESEKKVILEELKGGKDNPYRILIDETFRSSFNGHPYSKPIIGYYESINNLKLEDLESYYKNFYTTDNSCLIIAGDININETLNIIQESFNFESNKERKAKNNFELNNQKGRINIVKKDVKQNYLNIAYVLPGGYFKDFAVLHIISTLLGEFKNSPLKEKLQEQLQLVTDINTFFYVCRDYSLFIINTVFPLNVKPETVINEILTELDSLKSREIPFEQIYKAVLNHKADLIYNKESVSGDARNLIFYHITTGSYKNEDRFLKDLEKVNDKRIKKSLKKYFNHPLITLVTPLSEIGDINKKKQRKKILLKNKQKRLFELENGVKLIIEKNNRLPLVAFNAVSLGGLKFEKEKNNGLSYLMSKLLLKGSTNYSKREISEKFDFFSGLINSFSGRNSFGLEGIVLKNYFKEGFKIMIDSLINPLFLEAEIEKEKKNLIERIIADKDDIFSETLKKFYKDLFEGTYYSLNIKGSENSIKRLNKKNIENFHKKLVKSSNIVIGIVGDITDSDIELVKDVVSPISNEKFNYIYKEINLKTKGKISKHHIDKNQSHIIAGFKAPSLKNKDSITLKVLKNIVGNHSGKLFSKLREELGLCYHTTAFYLDGFEAGAFAFYIATSPENEELALEKIEILIQELLKGNISEKELTKAKNYIKGRKENIYQKLINISIKNSYNILYNLGIKHEKEFMEHLEKITLKDIIDVTNKYFIPENMVVTILSSKEQ